MTTSSTTPFWYASPAEQGVRANQLWPGIILPAPPEEFKPSTKSEVLLLHVPDAFNNLWNKVVPPAGYKCNREKAKTAAEALAPAPNKVEYKKPVWLAFDPEYGRGARPDHLWGQPNLAGSEVLSALIQFPDWPMAWHENGGAAPHLSGYQLYDVYSSGRLMVPMLIRWDGVRSLNLDTSPCDISSPNWASPSVRKC